MAWCNCSRRQRHSRFLQFIARSEDGNRRSHSDFQVSHPKCRRQADARCRQPLACPQDQITGLYVLARTADVSPEPDGAALSVRDVVSVRIRMEVCAGALPARVRVICPLPRSHAIAKSAPPPGA